MSERISHSYLQSDTPPDFPVEGRQKGQFFEGPNPGTILREIRLGEFAYGDTSAKRTELVLEKYIPFAKDQLDLLAQYGIRTVNPSYLISQREVIEEEETVNGTQEIERRTEEILSIVMKKIDDAVGFYDALRDGNPEHVHAYDDLAMRLVALFKNQYKVSGKVDAEFMDLTQYVIDPAAETIEDRTILVDVEPHEDIFERYDVRRMAEYGIANLAQSILELSIVSSACKLESLAAVIDAIESMPTIYYGANDIKNPLLDALKSRDIKKVNALTDILL